MVKKTSEGYAGNTISMIPREGADPWYNKQYGNVSVWGISVLFRQIENTGINVDKMAYLHDHGIFHEVRCRRYHNGCIGQKFWPGCGQHSCFHTDQHAL